MRFEANRLFLLAHEPNAKSDLLVYDLAVPTQPKLLFHITDVPLWTLEVSANGLEVVGDKLAGRSHDDGAEERAGYDLSVPGQPYVLEPAPARGPASAAVIRAASPPSVTFEFLDYRDGVAMSAADKRLRLWAIGTAAKPQLIREIGLGDYVDKGQILPGARTAVLSVNGAIGLYDISPLPFSAARLETAEANALAAYSSAAPKSYEQSAAGMSAAAVLYDAGADRLATEAPPGLSEQERIRIFNDYGFMLAQSGSPSAATPVLRSTVRLAPTRAVAWLNLGDAAQDTMAATDKESEKASSWTEARAAYDRYHILTGRPAPRAAQLERFNLPAALKTSDGVCSFVASAWNSGGEKWIAAKEGVGPIGGHRQRFWVDYQGFGCPNPNIAIADESFDQAADDTLPEGDPGGLKDLVIVPFHGRDYIVTIDHTGPYAVYEPGVGALCDIRRRFVATMAENHAPMCRAFAAGRLKSNLTWAPTPADSTVEQDLTSQLASLDGVADVEFEPGVKLRIGHFSEEGGGSCGDNIVYGVVLLNGLTAAQGPLAKSLLDAQRTWWRPMGGDANLYRRRGHTYIMASGGNVDPDAKLPSALLTYTKAGFAPLCRVAQTPIYSAAPISVKPSGDK